MIMWNIVVPPITAVLWVPFFLLFAFIFVIILPPLFIGGVVIWLIVDLIVAETSK